MAKNYVHGWLESENGFYVGDICYQLPDEYYDGIWCEKLNCADGVHDIAGYRVAVGSTAYGDGTYLGSDGTYYSVDAGVIGVIPHELCKDKDKKKIAALGRFVAAKKCEFEAEDGKFTIHFDTGEFIYLNTVEEEGEEEDYYDDEDETDDDGYSDEDDEDED